MSEALAEEEEVQPSSLVNDNDNDVKDGGGGSHSVGTQQDPQSSQAQDSQDVSSSSSSSSSASSASQAAARIKPRHGTIMPTIGNVGTKNFKTLKNKTPNSKQEKDSPNSSSSSATSSFTTRRNSSSRSSSRRMDGNDAASRLQHRLDNNAASSSTATTSQQQEVTPGSNYEPTKHDLNLLNANEKSTTHTTNHPNNNKKKKPNNNNANKSSVSSIRLVGETANHYWKLITKRSSSSNRRQVKKLQGEMDRIARQQQQRRQVLDSTSISEQQRRQLLDSTSISVSSSVSMGRVDKMKTTMSKMVDEEWRKEWRGIHLPPSVFNPTDKVRGRRAGEIEEENVLELPSPQDDHLSKDQERKMGDEQRGQPILAPNADAVEPSQLPPLPNDSGNDVPIPSLSNLLHPSTFSTQPSIPLYPLLFCIIFYLFLKHVFLRRVVTYQTRTRFMRSVRAKVFGMLDSKGRLSLYGANYKQFAISQEELEVQISRLKSNKKKKTSKSSSNKERSDGDDDDSTSNNTQQDKDGDNGGSDGDGGTGGSGNNGTSSQKEGDDNKDDNNDGSGSADDDGSPKRNSGSRNNTHRSNQRSKNASNNNTNNNSNNLGVSDKMSYLQWMKLTEELENAQQKLEQLSADVVCANERGDMLVERLSKVRKEKDALQGLHVQLKQQQAEQKSEKSDEQQPDSPKARDVIHDVEQVGHHRPSIREGQEGEVRWMKLNEELENAQLKVEQLSADVVCANERSEMLHDDLIEVKKDKKALSNELESRMSALDQQGDLLEEVTTENETLLEKLERHTEQAELLSQVKKAKDDALHTALEPHTMQENEELENAHQKIEQLSSDLTCANEREVMLVEKLSKLKNDKEILATELQSQRTMHKEVLRHNETKRIKQNEELECTYQKVEGLTVDVLCSNERNGMLEENLIKVKNENETLYKERAKVIAEYLHNISKLTEQNAVLREKVTTLDILNTTLEAENEEMDMEIDCLVDEIMIKDENNVELEDVEFDVGGSVGSLQVESLTDDDGDDDDDDDVDGNNVNNGIVVDSLRQELNAARADVSRLTQERDVAMNESKKLKGQLGSMEDNGRSSMSVGGISHDLTKATTASTVVDAEVVADVGMFDNNSVLSPITTTTSSMHHDAMIMGSSHNETVATLRAEIDELQCALVEINNLLGDAQTAANEVTKDLQRGVALDEEGNGDSSTMPHQAGEDEDDAIDGKDDQDAVNLAMESTIHGMAKYQASALLRQLRFIKEVSLSGTQISEEVTTELGLGDATAAAEDRVNTLQGKLKADQIAASAIRHMEMGDKLQIATSANKQLTEQVSSLQTSIENVAQQLREKETALEEAKSGIAATKEEALSVVSQLSKEMKKLHKAKALAEDHATTIKHKIEADQSTASARHEELDFKLEVATNANTQLTEQVSSLQKANEDAADKLRDKGAALEEAKSSIAALIEEASCATSQLSKEMTELRSAKVSADERATTLENKLETEQLASAAKLSEVECKFEATTISNNQMANQVSSLQKANDDVAKLLEEKDLAFEDAKTTIAALKEEASSAATNVSGEVFELRNAKAALENFLEEEKHAAAEMLEEVEDKLEAAQDANTKLADQVQSQQTANEELKEDNAKVSDELACLIGELGAFRQNMSELSDELIEAHRQIDDAKQDRTMADELIERLTMDFKTCHQDMTSLSDQLGEANWQLEDARKEKVRANELRKENEAIRAELRRLTKQSNKRTQKIDDLLNQFSAAHLEDADQNRAKVNELKRLIHDLKLSHDLHLTDEYNQCTQKIDDLLNELSASHQQLEDAVQRETEREQFDTMMMVNPPPHDQDLIVGFGRQKTTDGYSSSSFEDFMSIMTTPEEGRKSSSTLSSAAGGEIRQEEANRINDRDVNNTVVNDNDVAVAVEKAEASSSLPPTTKKSRAVSRLVRLWSSRTDVGNNNRQSKR